MKTLYLGTDPTHYMAEGEIVHYPVIKIVPRSVEEALKKLPLFTHVILTSKQAVSILFQSITASDLEGKEVWSIGPVTTERLEKYGVKNVITAKVATQEGMVALLSERKISKDAYFFLPRSSLSRPVLANFLQSKGWRYQLLDLYETQLQRLDPVPDLAQFDRIVFTSPSTVRGFLAIYGTLPKETELVSIGPITKRAVQAILGPGTVYTQ